MVVELLPRVLAEETVAELPAKRAVEKAAFTDRAAEAARRVKAVVVELAVITAVMPERQEHWVTGAPVV